MTDASGRSAAAPGGSAGPLDHAALRSLTDLVRVIPDFPEPGICFRDITPLLADVNAFRFVVDAMADAFAGATIDRVVGIEARGFLLAAPIAYRLGAALVPVRKLGKLPHDTESEGYQLEYGDDAIEVPAMCRDLVERATHPAPLSEIATELGGNSTPHQSRMEGIHYAHRQVAALNLARWDVPFSHPSALFPSSRSERDIRTRLGEDDRIAEFPFPVVGPFGHPVGSLRMPHYQIHRASVEARPENVKEVSGGVEFRFGDRLYRYDRMGLRPTPPPKEQEHA